MRKMSKTKAKKLFTKLIFTTSIVVIIGVFLSFSSIYKSYAIDNSSDFYLEVTVKTGDTLWNIAEKHSDNQDIRKLIYEIKQLNNLKKTSIYPGQILKIPAI